MCIYLTSDAYSDVILYIIGRGCGTQKHLEENQLGSAWI